MKGKYKRSLELIDQWNELKLEHFQKKDEIIDEFDLMVKGFMLSPREVVKILQYYYRNRVRWKYTYEPIPFTLVTGYKRFNVVNKYAYYYLMMP